MTAHRVAELWRYPVKGLGGQPLTSAHLARDGIAFDRVLGVTHDRVPLSPFGSWTTYDAFHALDVRPDLGGFSACVDPTDEGAQVHLRSPDGDSGEVTLDSSGAIIDDSGFPPSTVMEWFGNSTGTARLISSGSHLWDLADAPISIINEATVRDIGRAVARDLDPRRFRANIYIDGDEPWSELQLLGGSIVVGQVQLEILRPIERCRAISVDPRRGGTDINLPGALYTHFGHLFCGVYARVVTAGKIHEGDDVRPRRSHQPAARLVGATSNESRSAPRPGSIARVEAPAQGTVSLVIRDSTETLAQAAPGQHLRLHDTTAERPWWRNYTISGIDDEGVRITVRRHEDGVASPIIHGLRTSSDVVLSGPFGDASVDCQVLITLSSSRPVSASRPHWRSRAPCWHTTAIAAWTSCTWTDPGGRFRTGTRSSVRPNCCQTFGTASSSRRRASTMGLRHRKTFTRLRRLSDKRTMPYRGAHMRSVGLSAGHASRCGGIRRGRRRHPL